MKRIIRRKLHKFIVWYLRKCAGAFHYGPYNYPDITNDDGRYVVLMDDDTYHHFCVLAANRSQKEFHKMVWLLRDNDIFVP